MKLVQRTNGKYYIEYINNGKQVRLSCKTENKKTATDLLNKYQSGLIPTKEQTKIVRTNTVHSLVQTYLKHSEKYYTSKTLSSLKSHLNGLLKVVPKTLDINELEFGTLNNLVLNQCSPYQSRLCRSYLNMFYNWLIERNIYSGINPISRIKKIKLVQKLPVYIGTMELDLILSEIKNQNNDITDLLSDITLFAFFTGMRLNEITTLQWSQVNFQNCTISLDNQNTTTKSKRIRVIPISSKILDMLKNRFNLRTTNIVFEHNFSIRNINDLISKNFKRIITKLPDLNQSVHFHTLRHSFASNLVLKNINIVTVSKLLGHSDIKTTMVYSHINNSVLIEAINVL
jgi:integrase